MNLREMMTERILFAMDEAELAKKFSLTVVELAELSDLDFLEVFEDAVSP